MSEGSNEGNLPISRVQKQGSQLVSRITGQSLYK